MGNRLFRNQGAANPGQFTDVTVAAGVTIDQVPNTQQGLDGFSFGFSPRFSDLDGDGLLDLAVAGDFETSRLFWNNGNGTFTDGTLAAGVGTDENGMGSAIGDFDGDGRLDWFVTAIYADPGSPGDPEGSSSWGITGNRLYRNEGGRTFSDATDSAGVRDGGWGWGTTFFDYDNDGDQDLVMTNGFVDDDPEAILEDVFNNDAMRLWRNDGDGTFTEAATLEGVTDNGSGKGLLSFDYDNDGDLDLFVVNNRGEPILYRNDSVASNAWLKIELAGSESNSQGVGALITVTPELGGPEQIFEVNTGSNYLGQNDIRAHFGLGQLSGDIDQITVAWPSGTVQIFIDVQANRRVLINEDTGTLVTVPEPSTLILLAMSGLAQLAWAARRRN